MTDLPTDLFSDLPPADPADTLPLAEYAERTYLEYALSVVKDRALPDVCDGNKPVQRRILYSMFRMGLAFTGTGGVKPVKSARVVGDVLGRFHPHGDQAAYDALVRIGFSNALFPSPWHPGTRQNTTPGALESVFDGGRGLLGVDSAAAIRPSWAPPAGYP